MVLATAVTVGVVASGGVAIPMLSIFPIIGPEAVTAAAAATASAASAAAATGGAVATGAVGGAVAGGVAAGAGGGCVVTGAIAGGLGGTAQAVTATVATAASNGALAAALASNPLGWCMLGAETRLTSNDGVAHLDFNCWKPLLCPFEMDHHNNDLPPPRIREVLTDPRIDPNSVEPLLLEDKEAGVFQLFPFRVRNVWGGWFRIDAVVLPDGTLACHATPLPPTPDA